MDTANYFKRSELILPEMQTNCVFTDEGLSLSFTPCIVKFGNDLSVEIGHGFNHVLKGEYMLEEDLSFPLFSREVEEIFTLDNQDDVSLANFQLCAHNFFKSTLSNMDKDGNCILDHEEYLAIRIWNDPLRNLLTHLILPNAPCNFTESTKLLILDMIFIIGLSISSIDIAVVRKIRDEV